MTALIAPEELDTNFIESLEVQKRAVGNPGSKKKIRYKNIITAFDIETSKFVYDTVDGIEKYQSFMYVWKWQLGNNITVKGRTWQEFITFCEMLTQHLKQDEYICVFVHNLSYEFQFMRGIYPFAKHEVFALDRRKVLKCTMFNHIEFRCSYIHSNMSLDEYTNKMKAEHRKLSGDEYNYNIMRYPWTQLTQFEEDYTTNDVLGLVESIEIEMEHDKDNLYSFPLTSTGYVRRDVKLAMRNVSHSFVRNQLPDFRTYSMLREAFRGGNTHANRYYADMVLHNVKSADRSSSYPDVQCNCQFPITEFFYAGGVEYKELLELINIRKKAVLMRVSMTNVRLHDKYWGAPYLSRDKCRNIHGAIYDNGRILEAEYLETTLTDIDFKIVVAEYDFDDFVAFEVCHARYGNLPQPLIDVIIKYYVTKTGLKDVAGMELYYMKDKNKLNAIYGMSAQDPVKQTIDFENNDFVEREEKPEELLIASNKKAFFCYQWGVWTTAWARYRLEEGIRLAGDGFVYCDTDSVKYVGVVDWTEYNEIRILDSINSGAHAKDPQGVVHHMGVFEAEPDYYEFATLGAKKYCYREKPDSGLKVTIAGVTKKKGGKELEKHGGITAFAPGFIFHEAGGTEAIYNDMPEITEYCVEGQIIPITANVVIKDSTYTLGITAEYERLLEICQKGVDIQY